MNPRGGSGKDRGSVSPYSTPSRPGLPLCSAVLLLALRAPPTLLFIQRGSQGPPEKAQRPGHRVPSPRRRQGPAQCPFMLCAPLPGLAARTASLPLSSVFLFQLTWLLQYMDREGRLGGQAWRCRPSGVGSLALPWPRVTFPLLAQGAFLGSFHGGGGGQAAKSRTFLKRVLGMDVEVSEPYWLSSRPGTEYNK